MENPNPACDLSALVDKVEACDDPRQGLAIVEQQITRLAAEGLNVPEDLDRLHRTLLRDLVAQSQGR